MAADRHVVALLTPPFEMCSTVDFFITHNVIMHKFNIASHLHESHHGTQGSGCIMHNAYCIGTMTALCSIRLVYYGKKGLKIASDLINHSPDAA